MATLSGLHLLNTRPFHQAEALTQGIQDLGGRVTDCPTLSIRRLPFSLCASQRNADLMIFISQNAVNCFFSIFDQDLNLPSVCAIGQATAQALSRFHIQATTPSSGENSEALLALPILQQVAAQHILLVKGKGGRPLLADTLRQRGAIVHELEVYVRELPQYSKSFLWNIWHDTSINIILFTSQQSMEQLFTLLGEDAVPWIREIPCLVISNRLAETARALGIKTCLISETANILNCLIQFNQGMK